MSKFVAIFLFSVVVGINAFNLKLTCSGEGDCHGAPGVVITKRDAVTSINGQNAAAFDKSNYHLEFNDKTVNYIPSGLGAFFPNLKNFIISESYLKEVTKDDLAQFPKLDTIKLQGNDLKSLPGNLFESTPNVKFIVFSKNKIENIGHNILTPLKDVKQVGLGGNVCIDSSTIGSNVNQLVANLKEKCPEPAH